MATTKAKQGKDTEISWQAQKSAMTRERVLTAAIDCFINEGFANITTAKVATNAGVSRGAMLHHFPSKTELIAATVEYLHDKMLADFSTRISKIPKKLEGKARRRAGLDGYWEYLNSDLFISYHELRVASRTDPELETIIASSAQLFEDHERDSNIKLFSEWADKGDRFMMAMDLTKFLMEGMAMSQVTQGNKKRTERMMDYLSDRLEEIFEEGDDSAFSRHS
jgi:AcrR family transcriptional regulator